MKIRTSRRSSRSTNTPASAEKRTAGRRNVRIRALTAVVDPVDFDDDDGQAEDDHVAADLGRRLGEPEEQERPVPEDVEGAVGGGGRDGRGRSPAARHGALGRGAAAALRTGSPRSTNSTSRRSIVRRSTRTCRSHVWQRRPMSAPRRSISHVSPPHGWRRRSRTTSPRYRVSAGPVGHPAEGIKDADGHGPGRGRASSPAGSSARRPARPRRSRARVRSPRAGR